jgi:fibronectin type 3 domain-containing protein
MTLRRVRPTVVGVLVVALCGFASAVVAPAAVAGGKNVVTSTSPVPGQYIVTLADGTKPDEVATRSAQLADGYSGDVFEVYDEALPGFAVRMKPADAEALAHDPRVTRVEQDGYVSIAATQANPPSWGLDRIDQHNLPVDQAYSYEGGGATVHAYVLDTGLNLGHADFTGRVTPGPDFVDGDNDPSDCAGHGTHVSGIVGGTTFGVAKSVQLVPVRVLGCDGSGTISSVVAGVNWVTANAIRPAVANMSLGGSASPTLEDAVEGSIESGVVYTVSAGNSNKDACGYSPSGVSAAIVVGATTSSDSRASFSNFGTCVDLFAPGQSILSDFIGGPTATTTLSGTSMASPHVAGAVALYLELDPCATPAEVATAFTTPGSGPPHATPGVVTNAGAGSPNRLLYTGFGPATVSAQIGIGTVRLTWPTPLPCNPPVLHYDIYRNNESGLPLGSPIATVPAATNAYDDVVGDSAEHYYTVTATNDLGETPLALEMAATPSAPVLTATAEELAVHLAWTNPPDVGPPVIAVELHAGDAPGSETLVATLPPGQTSYDVQFPGAIVEHSFMVKAIKAGPVATTSNEVLATPLAGAPPDPASLSATAGNGQVTLNWTSPAANDGTGALQSFEVRRGTAAGAEDPTPIATLPGSQTSFVDTSVVKGTTYFYTVTATATFGATASNEQAATPFAVTDAVARTTNGSVTLHRQADATPFPAVNLGGYATSNPAVITHSGATLVFARGGDNALYYQRVVNGVPFGWISLGGYITADPVAVNDANDDAYVFVRGWDGAIYLKRIPSGGTPGGWQSLGGFTPSNPTAAVIGTTKFVFVRGGDNVVYVQRVPGVSPTSWSGLGGFVTSDPSATRDPFNGGGVTVFVRGGDNGLYRQHLSAAGQPGGWVGMGGFVTSTAGAVLDPGSNAVRAFVRGGDNAVWMQTLTSASGSAVWTTLGGSLFSRPSPVNDGNRTWVYALGVFGVLYVQQAAPVATGWVPIGGGISSDAAATISP